MKKYEISITGYGSELTIGSVTKEQKEILSNEDKDIHEIVNEDLDDFGGWNEIDDQFHCFGVSSPFTITISDEDGNELYNIPEENVYDYDADDFSLIENEYPEIDDTKDLLVCYTSEKGSFFLGYVELEGDFDITKLKIVFSDIEIGDFFYFGDIMSNVLYDGEEIDNWGGDTSGKSFDVHKNF